MRQRCKREK